MNKPDVTYYMLRVDSFGPNGTEGQPPDATMMEVQIEEMLRSPITPAQKLQGMTFNVEVTRDEG